MLQTWKTVQEFLFQPRVASSNKGMAIGAALTPKPERALGRARPERYLLVLRRSQSITIFVGSAASLSMCILATLPLLPIR
jgi:hypothetical protein